MANTYSQIYIQVVFAVQGRDYIRGQERHHARRSFRDEYLRFLNRYEIEHDAKYIFKPLD